MKANKNYAKLETSYLFPTISRKVAEYQNAHPEAKIIKLGIGDVTLPLAPAVVEAMQKAVAEMGQKETFRGYGPEQGYDFLKEEVQKYYTKRQVSLEMDEIFISDGAKSDIGNILDLFDTDNVVLVPDPVYPVYVDTNIMAGRKIIFANATAENHFLPLPDKDVHADIIYICSPNNPTGAVYNKEQLKAWVDYALKEQAIILFDAAYEAFIQDENLPKSMYEIEGAKNCAIEICSFSKTAGFTGLRCGYTIVPLSLEFDGLNINKMWLRRQTTKYNGVPYVVQRAAAAVFTEEGQKQTKEAIAYYKENIRTISQALDELGIWYVGGQNSAYVWLKCPNGMKSWEFFDYLLQEIQVVGTPGAGFGQNGEGFFRLTAFGDQAQTKEAVERLKKLFKN